MRENELEQVPNTYGPAKDTRFIKTDVRSPLYTVDSEENNPFRAHDDTIAHKSDVKKRRTAPPS